jgi:hypothetical protein
MSVAKRKHQEPAALVSTGRLRALAEEIRTEVDKAIARSTGKLIEGKAASRDPDVDNV